MTQEQLTAKVGIRRETIMRLEKAQYNPSLKLAIDISKVVNVPIEKLFISIIKNYAYLYKIGNCLMNVYLDVDNFLLYKERKHVNIQNCF